MNPLVDWRAILEPSVVLTDEEAARMDQLAVTHPEMVKLMCERMRGFADPFIAEWTRRIFGMPSGTIFIDPGDGKFKVMP